MKTLIKDCRLLDALGRFQKGSIGIDGDTISFISVPTHADDSQSPVDNSINREFDLVLEAGGKVALPGLISAHTHMSQAFGRGIYDDLPLTRWLEIMSARYSLTPEQAYWSTILACVEALKSGTTCISEMSGGSLESLAPVASAIMDSGIRAVVCLGIGDVQEGNVPPRFTRSEALKLTEKVVRKYNGECNGRITARLGPVGLPACSKEFFVECRRLSRDLGVGIHTHACEGERETRYAMERYGMGEVEALYKFGILAPDVQMAHVIWVNEDEIKMIADTGASVVHCPFTNMKIVDGISPMAQMYAAGVNVAVGFDGAASSANHDLLREGGLASLLQKVSTMDATVFPARDVLHMLTRGGARAVGLESEIGRLEKGFKADIILIDYPRLNLIDERRFLSNLIYTGSGADVHSVFVNGRLLVYDHKFLPVNEQQLLARITELMAEAGL